MADEPNQQRSRRALLAAAAGGAAALAATAALPLTAAAADPNDVVLGTANTATAKTSVTNTTDGGTGFAGTGTGTGYGLEGTSSGGVGSFSWSVNAPTWWNAEEHGPYTGVFGYAPAHPDPLIAGVGVWGDSDDYGVVGSGSIGVIGDGNIGVLGDGNVGVLGFGTIGVNGVAVGNASPGVKAEAASSTGLALQTVGKVRFSRSGIRSMKSGKASVSVTLAGTTASSKVFAVLATSEPGRWIRAVVPASGKFTIYLNTALRSSAKVSWFVLD